jgi:hypothetical protein
MKNGFVRVAFTALSALVPLLGSADLCTVGVLAGRPSLECSSAMGAALCGASAAVKAVAVRPAEAPRCSHCAPAAPARGTERPAGRSCCDLHPQAPGAAEAPVLPPPAVSAQPALPPTAPAAPAPRASWLGRLFTRESHAPPGAFPRLFSSRAPPEVL